MKRIWHVLVEGYKPFPMIFMEGEVSAEEAKREARLTWPKACLIEDQAPVIVNRPSAVGRSEQPGHG